MAIYRDYRLSPIPPPPCHVGYLGHSQVGWVTLNPDYQPFVDARVHMYRKPGAKASQFYSYPELTQALNDNLHLVLIWLGSNDIAINRRPKDIITDLLGIAADFRSRGTHVKFITVEDRFAHPTHPHYVPHKIYKASKNTINRVLQRNFPGDVILTGGLTFNASHTTFDGVHIGRQGMVSIQI